MAWFFALPDHQKPRHWLCRINESFCYSIYTYIYFNYDIFQIRFYYTILHILTPPPYDFGIKKSYLSFFIFFVGGGGGGHKNVRAPIRLTCHWRGQLRQSTMTLILNYFPGWNRANKPARRKSVEKKAEEKNIKKSTWNSRILKNKPKDGNSNFLEVFSSSKG